MKKDVNEKAFRAGVSIIDITGAVPSDYIVNDTLYARTLVLDDGNNRLVFVVADKQTLPREVIDETKKIILSAHKVDPKNVMISATHTHSATSASLDGNSPSNFPQRYSWNLGKPLQAHQRLLACQLADGVARAIANLQPAKIGWATGNLNWTFNRRWVMKEPVKNPYGGYDQAAFHPGLLNTNKDRPAGLVDSEVSVISVQTRDNSPIAILANYSSHHAGGSGGIPANHISADYFGVFAQKIQELIRAPNFVGIMSNGTMGDLSPMNYQGGEPATVNMKKAYERVQAMGQAVADEVYRVYKTIQYQDRVPLQVVCTELTLDVRSASPEMLVHANKMLSRPSGSPQRHSRERLQARYLMQMENEWPNEIPVILQTIKIGELAICTVPFELFAETGLEIKKRSPFAKTFTIGLANGAHGYLPTPKQHELGGYETYMGSNRVQTDGAVLVTDRLLEMLRILKNK